MNIITATPPRPIIPDNIARMIAREAMKLYRTDPDFRREVDEHHKKRLAAERSVV